MEAGNGTMFDRVRRHISRIAALPGLGTGRSGPEEPTDAAQLTQLIFDLTNDVRSHHGLPELRSHPVLAAAARAHSSDMCRRRFFDHANPDGEDHSVRIKRSDRSFVGASGENIFMIDSATDLITTEKDAIAIAQKILDGWMNSPGHRRNLLHDEWTDLGVGVFATVDDVYATQVFGAPLVTFLTPPPAWARPGERITLALRLGRQLDSLRAFSLVLRWPDSGRRFDIGGGRYLLGAQPLSVGRSGSDVTVDFRAGDLPGRYQLIAGENHGGCSIAAFDVRT